MRAGTASGSRSVPLEKNETAPLVTDILSVLTGYGIASREQGGYVARWPGAKRARECAVAATELAQLGETHWHEHEELRVLEESA